MIPPEGLVIERDLLERIRSAALEAAPAEAVGFLFGRVDGPKEFLPLRNIAADPTKGFRLDAVEVESRIEERGAPPLALFHSHPTDVPSPSSADISGSRDWPELLHLIVGLGDCAGVRCWRIFGDQVYPVAVLVR